MPEDKSNEISRRKFLGIAKRTGKAIVAGTLATSVLANEVDKGINGVKTSVGIFKPLYEKHGEGILAKDIPTDIDFYFREFTINSPQVPAGIIDMPPLSVITSNASGYNDYTQSFRAFPDEILNKIASNGTEIMLGDVAVPSEDISEETLRELQYFYMGVAGAGAALSIAGVKTESLNRRKFLKLTSATAVGFSLSASLKNLLALVSAKKGPQQDALKRIIARMQGIASHFHPEQVNTFFRNAVIAYKLISAGEDLKNKTGSPPKASFQTEMGHSGIEDFLQVGKEITEQLILAHPTGFLKRIVKNNGEIDKFSSSRFLKLPSNFRLVNGTVVSGNPSSIGDRTTVNTHLRDSLKKRIEG